MKLELKYKLLKTNDILWDGMKIHMGEIGYFLAEQKRTDNTIELLYGSLRLILSELLINKKLYAQYPMQNYSEQDFVNIVMESMNTPIPSIDDQKANARNIEYIRKIVWGHIKKHYKRALELLNTLNSTKDVHVLSEEETTILMECLAVAYVECLLRKREAILIESIWSD